MHHTGRRAGRLCPPRVTQRECCRASQGGRPPPTPRHQLREGGGALAGRAAWRCWPGLPCLLHAAPPWLACWRALRSWVAWTPSCLPCMQALISSRLCVFHYWAVHEAGKTVQHHFGCAPDTVLHECNRQYRQPCHLIVRLGMVWKLADAARHDCHLVRMPYLPCTLWYKPHAWRHLEPAESGPFC